MKDFIKWLGVNEKIAKVAVWLLIIMVFLILTNTMLESLGFPNYQITYDNLVKIGSNKIQEILLSWVITIMNFYSTILLVFRVEKIKEISKYALLYLIILLIITPLTNYVVSQIFIFLYMLVFCYLYSSKNWRYILYGFCSIFLNTITQFICYYCKISIIDISAINQTTRIVLSLDYFIIMTIIILVKEIYLKKRGEKNGRNTKLVLARTIQKRRKTSQENSKKSK